MKTNISNFLLLTFLTVLNPITCFSHISTNSNTKYEIEANFNAKPNHINASARIVLPKINNPFTNEVHIKMKSAGLTKDKQPLLNIKKIYSENDKPLDYVINDQEGVAVIQIPASKSDNLASADSIVLTIDYSLSLDDQPEWKFNYFGYFFFWSNASGDYNVGDLWYPDVVEKSNLPITLRDFEVSIFFPETYDIMTSGKLISETILNNQVKKHHYQENNIKGFSINLAQGFKKYTVENKGYQVTSFYPPRMEKEYKLAANLTLDAVSWYVKQFGFFPTKQIGIISGSNAWTGGFPSSNLFWIHHGNLQKEFIRWITSHELGHYYWGYYVLADKDTNVNLGWLMLANGIWVDQLYISQANDRSFIEQWQTFGSGDWFIDYMQVQLLNREQQLNMKGLADVDKLDFDYNSLVAHGKAATGVYLLSQLVGHENFLSILKKIVDENQNKPLTFEKYIKYLTQGGIDNADSFLKAWIRGDASIGFAIRDIKKVDDLDYKYRIIIDRTGTINYPLNIAIEDAIGNVTKKTIEGNKKRETIEVILKKPIKEVKLDPEGIVPMSNSSNENIYRMYLEALYRAKMDKIFLILAEQYLITKPEDLDLKRKFNGVREKYKFH